MAGVRLALKRLGGRFVAGAAWTSEANDGRMAFRVGIGHDTHRLEPGRPLVLGGVVVPFDRGPVGHSDGDVLLHALVDALLGALGKGDIGDWFPNSDPRHKDRPSCEFVAEVLADALPAGGIVENVDAVIFAEQPRLGAHKPAIRRRLAELLGIAEGQVNVKAKTGELVGPIGRGEAIAAEVVVLVQTGEA